MKKVIFSFALPFLSLAAMAQTVHLTGTLNFKDPVEKVYISYMNGAKSVRDSAMVNNGKFTFTGPISGPTQAHLLLKDKLKEGVKPSPWMTSLEVFLESGQISIKSSHPGDLKVSGSKSQVTYESFIALLKPYNEKARALYSEARGYSQSDKAATKKVYQEVATLEMEKLDKVYIPYIKSNPRSNLSLVVLDKYAGDEFDADRVETAFNYLAPELKNSTTGKMLKSRIESARTTAIGAIAKDFTQNDTEGKPVSLSDFRGKYVLLDFWASWCVPCRAENPNVVKAYNKYKNKNFTVLAVSLDDEKGKKAWIDAIKKDGLPWTNVSELNGWKNVAATLYGVKAVPMNFLIDSSGKIIAKELRGENLDKVLSEILK